MADKTFDLSVLLKMADRFSNPLRQAMLNLRKATNTIKNADTAMLKFGKSMKSAGDKMKNVGQSMSMYLTAPVVGFGALALRSASEFDAAMNMVGAVTRTQIGDTVLPQFGELREAAKRLGATTQFSAKQVAGGMQFLGMAGMDANEILGAIPKTLELAASAQMDMASAADIVTNIMASQQMGVEDLSKANDILVSAFTRANVDLRMLGESFKYAGNITRDAGVTTREAAAAFGLLGSMGIQAQMAGTGLRGALVKMMAPTSKIAKEMSSLGMKIYEVQDGKRVLRPLVDLVKEFERAGVDSAKATEMFGLRAGPVFAALVAQGSDKLENFIKLMKQDVGLAAAVAEAQMKGLPGVLKEIASAWEAVQIAFRESGFGDFVVNALRKVASFLRNVANTNPELLAIAATFAAILAAIGPIITMVGLFLAGLGGIVTFSGSLAVIGAVFLKIGFIIAGVIAGISVLIGLIKTVPEFFNEIVNEIKRIPEVFDDAIQGVISFAKNVENVVILIADKIKNIMPDFMLKWFGGGPGQSILGQAEAARNNPQVAIANNSRTDVIIKVKSDEGTQASIDKFSKSGEANVNLINDGYLGFMGGLQ